jgi:hypothetical protein
MGHISAFSFYATNRRRERRIGGLYQQPFWHYEHLTAVFCSMPSPLQTVFLSRSSTAAFIWAMVSGSMYLVDF